MNTQQTNDQAVSDRDNLLNALVAHISKRTGMDMRDYARSWADKDGIANFRSEYRSVLRDRLDALKLLSIIRWRVESIPFELLASNATEANRLHYKNGAFGYHVGQYWPTEYRSAACRYLRDCYVQGMRACGMSYEQILKQAKNELGRGVVNRWFY